MKTAIIIVAMLLCSAAAFAQPPQGASPLSRETDKGGFVLELAVNGNTLKNGINLMDLTLRDRAGKEVEGAEITVTPWMPVMGHGVWEKPVVTERGGGKYQVGNVAIIMGGLWELRVAVTKGREQERASFPFYVAEQGEPVKEQPEKPREGLSRQSASYSIPDVTLLNQDGRKVNLRALIDGGKPVIVNFIFTTCTTICPVMTATFSSLRGELGAGAADRVQLISISIDPENDRPERMKQYLSRFNWGPGWEFLTGSREDIGKVLNAFDAFVVDKMSHEPLFVSRAPNSKEWVRVKGLVRKKDLMLELERMEKK